MHHNYLMAQNYELYFKIAQKLSSLSIDKISRVKIDE